MHWRITVEAVDPTGKEYLKEFLVEKDLDELADGRIGFPLNNGKTVIGETSDIYQPESQFDCGLRRTDLANDVQIPWISARTRKTSSPWINHRRVRSMLSP